MVDHSTVTRSLKKFRLDYMNLDNQAGLGRPKTMDFEVKHKPWRQMQQVALERISGELVISLSNVVHYLNEIGKCIKSCWIALHITKILYLMLSKYCALCYHKIVPHVTKIS